jgi:hypothetical protein
LGLKSQDWNKINEQEMIERQTMNNLIFLPLDEAANVMAIDISAGIQRALTRYPHFVMSKNDQTTLHQSASKLESGRSFRPDRSLNKQLKSLTKIIKHEPDKSAKEQLLKQRNLVLQDRKDAGNRTRRKKREIETKKAFRRYTQNSWKFLESKARTMSSQTLPPNKPKETFESRWKDTLKDITY